MKYPDRYAGGIGLEGDTGPAAPRKAPPAPRPRRPRPESRRPVYRAPPSPAEDDDMTAEMAAAGEEIYRYAGGVGLGADPGTKTAVEAPAVDLPKSVRRYLLPSESDRNIICLREHWAAIGVQLATLAATLAAAVALNSWLYEERQASVWIVRLVWLPVGVAAVWYLFHRVSWATRWIVITPLRIMTVGGLIKRNVVPLPMKLARDSELSYTVPGRLLGYATIKTQSFGTDHQLAAIRFVPDPDATFNAIWAIKLPGEGGVIPGGDILWLITRAPMSRPYRAGQASKHATTRAASTTAGGRGCASSRLTRGTACPPSNATCTGRRGPVT